MAAASTSFTCETHAPAGGRQVRKACVCAVVGWAEAVLIVRQGSKRTERAGCSVTAARLGGGEIQALLRRFWVLWCSCALQSPRWACI